MGVLGGAEAFPRYGWWGMGMVAVAAGAAQIEAAWAPSAASILAWWGLALAVDAAAFRQRGGSPLRDAPDAFVWMAVLSIFLGVAVEWAAGRLAVWAYLGLPFQEFLRYGVQGAVFSAYVPALHGAAGTFGADYDSGPRAGAASRRASLTAMTLGAALLAGTLAAPYLEGVIAMLLAMVGLWLFCDGANALRDRPSLLARRRGQIRAWVSAGVLLAAAGGLVEALTGQGRISVQADGPVYLAYALAAVSGPALRAAYLFLADTLGLPAVPPREELPALLR